MALKAVAASSGGGAAASIVVGTTAITGGAAYAILTEDGSQNLAASSNFTWGGAAAGTGIQANAGTATTDVPAFSLTRTNNNAAVATGVKWTFTDTTSAATFKPFQILGGSGGTTNLLSVSKSGVIHTDGSTTYNVPLFEVGAATNPSGLGVNGVVTPTMVSNSVGVAAFLWSTGVIVKSSLVVGWTDAEINGGLDTAISRVSAGVVGVGTGAAASVAGSISCTNVTTIATSSTGTAVILDGSNVLRPLTSAERFKTNIRRDWQPTKKQIAAYLSVKPMVFDYRDHDARCEEKEIFEEQEVIMREHTKDGIVLRPEKQQVSVGFETVELEAPREGVKNVLGMSADEAHAAGLTELLNYDNDGLPLSFREHAHIAYLKTIVADLYARVTALETR